MCSVLVRIETHDSVCMVHMNTGRLARQLNGSGCWTNNYYIHFIIVKFVILPSCGVSFRIDCICIEYLCTLLLFCCILVCDTLLVWTLTIRIIIIIIIILNQLLPPCRLCVIIIILHFLWLNVYVYYYC